MVNFRDMLLPSSVFSAYASVSASIMLLQTLVNQLVPRQVQTYMYSAVRYYFKPKSSSISLIIEEMDGMTTNEIYTAAETYLYSKIDSNIDQCLKISKRYKETNINIKFARCEKVVDVYEDVEITWMFNLEERKKKTPSIVDEDSEEVHYPGAEKRYFELSFHKMHKAKVMTSYVPFFLQRAKDIRVENKAVKLHTLSTRSFSSIVWESITLEHPCTFDTLAMDSKLKEAIIDDLDRFVRRKKFYRKVGKTWKRGYLLYGPPGTGKSSLIAAMANHLKFDIYDLELGTVKRDSDLRRILLKTANRSILVIEDIDCSVVGFPDRKGIGASTSYADDGRRPRDQQMQPPPQFTLSGLLNFIDGLWSSCGDERIIIFTTNHKEKLDPALLRAGRMDVHISMSYLTRDGFKLLASNYLGNIDDRHRKSIQEIEEMIETIEVTPAEVAEELMKSDDADCLLSGLLHFLKRKKMQDDEINLQEEADTDEIELPKGKRLKLDVNKDHDVTLSL